jgi:hypothetical protein
MRVRARGMPAASRSSSSFAEGVIMLLVRRTRRGALLAAISLVVAVSGVGAAQSAAAEPGVGPDMAWGKALVDSPAAASNPSASASDASVTPDMAWGKSEPAPDPSTDPTTDPALTPDMAWGK